MRRRTIQLIALKELRDTLRDRRTLFVALVLPLLLYPALLLGLTQIVGATQRNLEAEQQRVLVDCEAGGADLVELFRARGLEPVVAGEDPVLGEIRAAIGELESEDLADGARERLRGSLGENHYAGAVLFQERFEERIAAESQGEARVLYDPTDEPSKTARGKIERALREYVVARREELRERYPDDEERLRFAEEPVRVIRHEVATSQQKGAYSFAPMLGLLIVIMALTGAFYPAVDLAAGEKERGTMETLLVAPVTRREIVMGKFMAVWVIAVVTALANLIVMGLTFSKLAGMVAPGEIAFAVPFRAVLAVMVILIPTAALFSALALALSSFATSYKEGQHYLTPLFLVATPMAMVALLPNVEIGYALALVPVSNVVLLVKAMLLGGEVVGPALVATVATAVYAGMALVVAVAIFRRESVLFRGGGGRGYDPKALRAARAGLPPEGAGVFAFFLVLALMFFLSSRVETAADAVRAFLLAQAAVLVPTLALARRFKVDWRATFRLRAFPVRLAPLIVSAAVFGVVFVLGLALPFLREREPTGFERVIESLIGGSPILFFVLLAVVPPVCEEFLCRGFLLASFRSRFGVRGAVVLSALLFGLLHLDLARLPGTFFAGLLLGYVLVRTGSLLAAILFHMTWNGVLALAALVPAFGLRLEGLGPAEIVLAIVGLAGALFLLARAGPAGIDKA
jgi:sodium transport system permease protein